MLETFSKNVMKRGKPHFNAKTKIIEDRLETINNAEEAKYPITTGLLLGITETKEELIQDIENLGHIDNQGVIVKKFMRTLSLYPFYFRTSFKLLKSFF